MFMGRNASVDHVGLKKREGKGTWGKITLQTS